MKWVYWFKEKCTWLNFWKIASFYFYATFILSAIYSIWVHGLNIPDNESTATMLSFIFGFIFSRVAKEIETKEENDSFVAETTFIIEEMRNEIEQLKQSKESKE